MLQLQWASFAACKDTDPDLFFPTSGAGLTDAKRICASCSCRKACLEYALQRNEKHGVWGGTSERERRILRRARRKLTTLSA